jgi:putative flippase GtrA
MLLQCELKTGVFRDHFLREISHQDVAKRHGRTMNKFVYVVSLFIVVGIACYSLFIFFPHADRMSGIIRHFGPAVVAGIFSYVFDKVSKAKS